MNGVFEEVDIASGRVLQHWESLDHVDLDESYAFVPEDASEPYDYFHINSIKPTPDGRYHRVQPLRGGALRRGAAQLQLPRLPQGLALTPDGEGPVGIDREPSPSNRSQVTLAAGCPGRQDDRGGDDCGQHVAMTYPPDERARLVNDGNRVSAVVELAEGGTECGIRGCGLHRRTQGHHVRVVAGGDRVHDLVSRQDAEVSVILAENRERACP
jgi:hypothetical protein